MAGTGPGIDAETVTGGPSVTPATRRRITLEVLGNATGPVRLDDVASMVADREPGGAAGREASPERLAISLHHNHLPRLDAGGLIDYDPEAHVVNGDSPER